MYRWIHFFENKLERSDEEANWKIILLFIQDKVNEKIRLYKDTFKFNMKTTL